MIQSPKPLKVYKSKKTIKKHQRKPPTDPVLMKIPSTSIKLAHLELFAGTGSFCKVSKQYGYKVISIDNNEDKLSHNLTIETDILTWNYREYFEANGFPDVITASPPCTSFGTIAVNTWKCRDYETMKPIKSNTDKDNKRYETAIRGDLLLEKTFEIINHCKEHNTNLKYIIENPKGFMWKHSLMKNINRCDTWYSLYDHMFAKYTSFFNNFNLELRTCETHYRTKSKSNMEQNKGTLADRSIIPENLVIDIFNQIPLPTEFKVVTEGNVTINDMIYEK
jgi:hypothetical protein